MAVVTMVDGSRDRISMQEPGTGVHLTVFGRTLEPYQASCLPWAFGPVPVGLDEIGSWRKWAKLDRFEPVTT